ncbi:MAG: hypothetical protein U0931_41035 [Vulcanimicrobiota bacterium]
MTAPQRALMAMLAVMLLYGLVRQNSLNQLAQQVREEESGQRRFLATLATAAEDNQPLPPDPKPDTLQWLSKNVLAGGLDRHLLSNSPTLGGAGAEVKLRNLKPKEVTFLLTKMTKSNLIFRHLLLSDVGSRSIWEVHLIVENPKPEASP